jgi:hypothetical protein
LRDGIVSKRNPGSRCSTRIVVIAFPFLSALPTARLSVGTDNVHTHRGIIVGQIGHTDLVEFP